MNGAARERILLAAGGTGGHLFPAQALAEVLAARGYAVDLVTDTRGGHYGAFPAGETHVVPADTLRGGGPLAYLRTAAVMTAGIVSAFSLIGRLKPKAVVGFGGYPTIPPLLAARLRRVPTLIHEQNAVMGRANRLLAGRVHAIATSFPEVKNLAIRDAGKVVRTGAPVRAAVIEAAATAYKAPSSRAKLRLLVFGGSQGARAFSEVVPAAIAQLDEKLRKRLVIVQQCREEDLERVRETYGAIGVDAECAAFFPDLPARMAAAHLVIARSGASTIAELAVIGRPAILVPLPHAVDDDQMLNARAMDEAGGGWLMPQSSFTPSNLAEALSTRFAALAALEKAAAAARAVGNPQAAQTLADVVTALAEGRRAESTNTEAVT